MPGRRFGTPTDAFAVMFAERLVSSAERSSEDSMSAFACLFLDVVLPRFPQSSCVKATLYSSFEYGFRQLVMLADMTKS